MSRRPGGEVAVRARLEAAPGLTSHEGHRLAGLLDGESHLAVAPNNGDGWRCECSVNLRDDDAEVLAAARRALGIGRVVAVPARNTSRPQVAWVISTKLECSRLVTFIDAHPLRGRKRAEYELWREAVRAWALRRYGYAPGVRSRLEHLAGLLRTERIYREPHPDAVLPVLTDPYAEHYFAGFFSGEGSFGLQPRAARFVIKLRRDDRPLLDAFRRDFRLGSVCDVAPVGGWSPAAIWHVTAARGVLRGIEIFERAGLLGRKARQFGAWRPGAEAIARAKVSGAPADPRVVERARLELRTVGAYAPSRSSLPHDGPEADARDAYLDVLRTWSAVTEGPLTCTAYETMRRRARPNWPKRETLAATFGGWAEALAAAGLEQ
jgi:LAGLIDADG DNA endonuclease family protein